MTEDRYRRNVAHDNVIAMETLSALSALWGEPPVTVEFPGQMVSFDISVDVSPNKLPDKHSAGTYVTLLKWESQAQKFPK